MEIKSKLDEDRIGVIRKEPEIGDLVAYNILWDGEQYSKELGIVTETYEEDKMALVYWLTSQETKESYTKHLLNVRLKEEK